MVDTEITIHESKIVRLLDDLDQNAIQEFLEVVNRACQKKPSRKDLRELKKWMDAYPELWKAVFDITNVMEENFIKNMISQKALIVSMQKNTEAIRNGMEYGESSVMEKMLIDNIVVSWLGVQYANYQLLTRMNREEKIIILEFWERRLSMAQQRYLRVCETLAKIRRLMSGKPAVQVNIAAQGGQQVNVAGDVVKR